MYNFLNEASLDLTSSIPFIVLGSIIVAILYFIRKIQNQRIQVADAVSWLVFLIITLIISTVVVFFVLNDKVNQLDEFALIFGFSSYEIMIVVFVFAWIWLRVFKLVSKYSELKYKTDQLTQELAKVKYELEHKTNIIAQSVDSLKEDKIKKAAKQAEKMLESENKKTKKKKK